MMENVRTEGWPEGAVEDCTNWSRQQHRQVACDLLNGACVLTQSEDGWNGEPAHRHYETRDDETGIMDYSYLLAAIAHLMLAQGYGS